MYIILVYDIGENRTQKACKYLRRHLNWVQRSVFEGDITEARLIKIKSRLKKLMKGDDSVYIYTTRSDWIINREVLGKELGSNENVL